MQALKRTPSSARAALTMRASRMSWKGRTSESRSDRTLSAIQRRVVWDIVGLLVGWGLGHITTNPCPREADICLSFTAGSTYEYPSAIPLRDYLDLGKWRRKPLRSFGRPGLRPSGSARLTAFGPFGTGL